MYKYSKWKWPERTEEEEEEAITNFNKTMQESENSDEVEWIREAAEKCLLVEEVARFPKRPKKERKNTILRMTGDLAKVWWPSDT